MKLTSATRWLAVLLIAVLAASCTTSRKTSTNAGDTGNTGSVPGGATAQGVTASTIKVGFSYIDLDDARQVRHHQGRPRPLRADHQGAGRRRQPRGGINGRKLVLVTAKYSPIGNDEQLAACTKLTQDDKVFAVLDGCSATTTSASPNSTRRSSSVRPASTPLTGQGSGTLGHLTAER